MGQREIRALVIEVQDILQDTGGVHYTEVAVATKIHEGELAVGILRPDALSTEGDLPLVAGTRQALPAGATRLRDVLYNRGEVGSEADGAPIRLVDRESLDALGAWRTSTGSAVLEYVYDERDPAHFDVYPGLTGARVVRAVWEAPTALYAFSGGALDPLDQTIGIGDDYAPALVEWALYRLLSRQDDLTPATEDGANHDRRFFEMLGISVTADATASLKNLIRAK